MLILSKTQDCSYIKIESDVLSDFILSSNTGAKVNPGDEVAVVKKEIIDVGVITPTANKPTPKTTYTSFTISSTINCCTDNTVTQSLNEEEISAGSSWNLQFPQDSSSNITGLYFANLYNGLEFNALEGYSLPLANYSCSTGSITDLFPIVQLWFTTNFGVTVTQSYTYDAITGECVYTIADLPPSLAPMYLQLENTNIFSNVYFSYYPLNNAFFSGSTLYLTPEFYGGLVFNDGVYSVTLTFITADGKVITETTCFFFDCKTGCEVSTKIKELEEASNPKNATNIFLLHYTLTEGSNCGCNCEELCEIFRKLCNNLNSTSCLCGCV